MEALNLPMLTQALRNTSPKPSPMKKVKPRTVTEKQVVIVRRSGRCGPCHHAQKLAISNLLCHDIVATITALEEVVKAAQGRIPFLWTVGLGEGQTYSRP